VQRRVQLLVSFDEQHSWTKKEMDDRRPAAPVWTMQMKSKQQGIIITCCMQQCVMQHLGALGGSCNF
jgi:hypothetical protein